MTTALDIIKKELPDENVTLIGCAGNGQFQIHIYTHYQGPENSSMYPVVSVKEGADYVPKAIAMYPHIPYNMELFNVEWPSAKEQGVFITVTEIFGPTAQKVKLKLNDIIHIVDVTVHSAPLFIWDTVWLAPWEYPKPIELLIDDVWVPTASPAVAATADEFFRVIAASDRDDMNWATDAFYGNTTWEEKLALVQCVVDRADPHAPCLANLGPSAIEDMMNHDLLDHIERDQNNKLKWQNALNSFLAWQDELEETRKRWKAEGRDLDMGDKKPEDILKRVQMFVAT